MWHNRSPLGEITPKHDLDVRWYARTCHICGERMYEVAVHQTQGLACFLRVRDVIFACRFVFPPRSDALSFGAPSCTALSWQKTCFFVLFRAGLIRLLLGMRQQVVPILLCLFGYWKFKVLQSALQRRLCFATVCVALRANR